jgi:outer membrane receptor protein involved in Fe transport
VATFALAAPAFAQEAASSLDEGEIVVTALKRDTNIQDTPIAISAVGGEAVANSGAQTIADLQSSVPSLNFVDGGPAQRRVVIRGIQGTGEPLVGTYYDETPVTGSIGAGNDAGGSTPELRLFDVERVEVLRGPQGTLYGSGSMGGTLRVIYKKPSNALEGAVDVGLSSTKGGEMTYEGNAMINVPIVDDMVSFRAVGFYRDGGGYIDNTRLGIKDINSLETYGGRFLLRVKPTPDLTIDFSAYLNRLTTDTASWTLGAGEYNSDNYVRQPVKDDLDLYSATATYDFGGVALTGVVSYLDRSLSTVSDVSGYIRTNRTPAACARLANATVACDTTTLANFYTLVDGQSTSALFPQQEQTTWTAELRLSSTGSGPINWTVGGFYSDRNTTVQNPQVNANPVSGVVIQPLQVATIRYIDDTLKQIAGFADVSWDITDALNLTVGARYFNYDKHIEGRTPIPSILVGARVTPLTVVESSESGWVFKFNGSYKITDDMLFYAEAAQGFRPGGANQVLGLDAALTPYSSDGLWNYEIGLKNTLLDRKLFINVDAFLIDWTDMQITGRTPNGAFSYITNAGAARVKGLELEIDARPVQGLSIAANASYIDAKLSENQATTNVSAPGLKDDRIPYVPKFTAGIGVQYKWALTDAVNGLARVDANHVGASYSDFRPNGTYTRHIDAYQLVNLRLGVEKDEFGAFLFVSNLFDSLAITRSTSSAIAVGRTLVNSARPRTIGINLRAGF